MRIRVICCRVFAPEMEVLAEQSSDELSFEYLPLRAHDEPDRLRMEIQARVDAVDCENTDAAEGRDIEAVVLAYGLCGNAVAGIRSGAVPLYIPRAHDCSQILLGGHHAHRKYFGENPSRGWTSRGYITEGGDLFRTGDGDIGWEMEDLVKQYGEENARYIWETMHGSDSPEDPYLYFLDVPETRDEATLHAAEKKAVERFKELRIIPATLDFLARLLGGRGGDEILIIPPGGVIQPSWDDDVMKACNE